MLHSLSVCDQRAFSGSDRQEKLEHAPTELTFILHADTSCLSVVLGCKEIILVMSLEELFI